MPRKYASVNVEIWNDPEFRKLPPAAQHLYMLLWTAPALSFCGVHEWRPGRLTKLSSGFTEEHTRTVAESLVARHFLVIDEETEEVLVRSWARFDGLLKQPRLAVSYSSAYAAVFSPTLRQVLAHETQKMRKLWPEWACWKDQRVAGILDHEAVSAKDLPTPQDPFGDGFGPDFTHGFTPGFGLGLAQTDPAVYPSVYPPPTPAPTPAPNTEGGNAALQDASSTPSRATQISDDWLPQESHLVFAAKNGLDLNEEADDFRDHCKANGKTYRDFGAAFSKWLRRSVKFAEEREARKPAEPQQLRPVQEIPQPPDGLSDQEYADWWRQNMGGA